MKVWMIILRASSDEKSDDPSFQDEVFTLVYKDLAKAKRECQRALDDDEETRGELIEWAEVTEKGGPRKMYGRPTGEREGHFELLQVEVVE